MNKNTLRKYNREKEEQESTFEPIESIADTPEEKEESNIVHVIKSRGMFTGFLVA